MGDTFEYLLSEMATAGKNGQFRTPRHLIRFMVELLDPEPDKRIIDPAAGTGGFLFSSQQYLQRKFTSPDTLRIEWDGAPHRAVGDLANKKQDAAIHNGANFVGVDNDRTMARIGWMNMILHGIQDPHLVQGDSLSKRDGKPDLAKLLTPESYDFVLANPPFTGTIDSGDLEPDSKLFPRAAATGKKAKEAITNKSELLFCWLMLDLLDIGGRCAVIVPEGVLFGNTDAHRTLRRELLTEHVVEGVISLPAGVFQPYTGVKTSILIFRKQTKRENKKTYKGQRAHTQHVWFYEIEADGFTMNAKRDARPTSNNDLWDALEKFRAWKKGGAGNEKNYYQPRFTTERWRQVSFRDTEDKLTPFGEAFGGNKQLESFDGDVWAVHELFTEYGNVSSPDEIKTIISNKVSKLLSDLLHRYLDEFTRPIWEKWKKSKNFDRDKAVAEWQKAIKKPMADFNRACRDIQKFFEPDDAPALPLWKWHISDCTNATLSYYEQVIRDAKNLLMPEQKGIKILENEIANIAREVAKLDGFDVTLRSLLADQVQEIGNVKHWVVPVRAWAENEEWQSADGNLKGSHDADGQVRPEYIQAIEAEGLYDKKGNLKEDLLDPDCIEGRDWNLAGGQYKPFDFTQLKSDKSVIELIGELRNSEEQIIASLDKLRATMEGQ
jgi:type I restriction enzyme M protein